ncbi:hypothetical protein PG911_16055 [Tenacibaculum ovolyticum]|jgi:hypothetical protein|uniref:hypothetical protein n=1 Tax=Tenacibaculum ovolyticum TaxID=104270 RepID=UPI00040D9E0E|nr:hypothetical protein [Tenacibaculum ovolyticum]WBX76129.1 hypothetical protein PG911_16055 [Tenacibaculum ovolyticum]
MKKVILTMCVAGALLATSCKNEKEGAKDVKDTTVEAVEKATEATTEAATKVVEGAEKATEAVAEGAEKATEAVKSAIEGITIPEFKDPKVGAYLQSYTEYAKSYIAANGSVSEITKLAPKGAELATKMSAIAGSLDAESAVKFSNVMTAIQSKMAPAAK